MTGRPTIADIARRAGVSKGAVSYALNGRPGVSAATRERVRAIAAELGWSANTAARTLSGARVDTVGLAVARPARTLGLEPFFMGFVSGIEGLLAGRSVGLLLQVVPDHQAEVAAYRRWWAGRRVDGVIVIDLFDTDPRIPALRELGLPFVVVGDSREDTGVTCVWSDETAAMAQVMDYLAALGHRRIARVCGVPAFRHTAQRTAAFRAAADRLGLGEVLTQGDYTGEDSARATRLLLARSDRDRPTAIVYDSDVMAVAGLGVAAEMGIDVPGQLSVVSWDDSTLCRLTHPPLTALTRDASGYGRHAATRLLAVVEGAPPAAYEDAPHELCIRGSTAPCRS
ncbi:LacI family DNA-binding transcriptional regulator [Micromonospora zhanjiangensis]|uniref:LacI family DNA-binding transcriptional regulator n=1 Tax=Micromonospora zhanjiangensis TaxID=1522057 RepID=A0ABV8KIJ7_9ACTN